MSSASGPLLGLRYQLDARIATGGFGEVWRATDMLLGRPVAVKLLQAGYLQHAETLARFRAEARHAAALSHENIARVYDYGEPDPPHPPFLVMELVDGPPLAGVLASGPMDPARAMDIVAQAANGLHAAHQAGLVHRDIKPGNLLLSHGELLKITDFGIAHATGSAPVTGTGMIIGTAAYLAPERVRGSGATPASDLYSLGIVGYECLAGAPPFSGVAVAVAVAHRDSPLPPLPASVPADVAALVAELTVKDPAARPRSAAEVARRAAWLRDRMLGGTAAGAGGATAGAGGATARAGGATARAGGATTGAEGVATVAGALLAECSPSSLSDTVDDQIALAAARRSARPRRRGARRVRRLAVTAAAAVLGGLLGLVLASMIGGAPPPPHPVTARSSAPVTARSSAPATGPPAGTTAAHPRAPATLSHGDAHGHGRPRRPGEGPGHGKGHGHRKPSHHGHGKPHGQRHGHG